MIKNEKQNLSLHGLRFNMTVFQLRADDICLDIFQSCSWTYIPVLLLNKKHFLLHKLNHKIYNVPVVK